MIGMMGQSNLYGKRIAIIATDYFEQDELIKPKEAMQLAGAEVDIIAPHSGEIRGLVHTDPGQSVEVNKTLDQVHARDYDAVILPGGAVNADQLRTVDAAKRFVREMFSAGKPVAAICHAPWLLVSAGLTRGKRLTSYFTLEDDIRNAGGQWSDQEVIQDRNLITSRKPSDIPAFNNAVMAALAQPYAPVMQM